MRVAWLVLLVGCYHPANEQACAVRCPCPAGLTCGDDGVCHDSHGGCGGIDASMPSLPDASPKPAPGCFFASQGGFFDSIQFCVDMELSRGLSTPISTSVGSADCDLDVWGLTQYCVITGNMVSINGLAVTGSRPLLVVANTITLAGKLDATSYPNGTPGPGADDATCSAPMNGSRGNYGGTGGAGGTLGSVGGNGGDCDTLTGPVGIPALLRPNRLRGGCPGSSGGISSGANFGHSGGGVYLLASSLIDLGTGTILAGGQGGGGGSQGDGGGGGGSGGMIVLDAPVVSTGTALVLANGGGGGGGANDITAGGVGGEQGTISAADGGSGDVTGGDGSSGANGNGIPGTNGNGKAGVIGGGGGGGGGAGYILVFSSNVSGAGQFSPARQ